MIIPSLGKWSTASGALFFRERIYWRGFKWTPFCWLTWRYKKYNG